MACSSVSGKRSVSFLVVVISCAYACFCLFLQALLSSSHIYAKSVITRHLFDSIWYDVYVFRVFIDVVALSSRNLRDSQSI